MKIFKHLRSSFDYYRHYSLFVVYSHYAVLINRLLYKYYFCYECMLTELRLISSEYPNAFLEIKNLSLIPCPSFLVPSSSLVHLSRVPRPSSICPLSLYSFVFVPRPLFLALSLVPHSRPSHNPRLLFLVPHSLRLPLYLERVLS